MNNLPILILAKHPAEYMVMRNRIMDVFSPPFKNIRMVTSHFQLKGLRSFVVIECDGWSLVEADEKRLIELEIKTQWRGSGLHLWFKENDIGRQIYYAKEQL